MSVLGADAGSRPVAGWRNGWKLVVLVTAIVGAGLLVVLVVTGIILANSYRPNEVDDATRDLHRMSSALLVINALVTLVSAIGWTVTAGRRRWAVAPAGLLFGAVVAASITGFLLPWDQLGLFAVTVGDLDGVWHAAFDDGVRFVLIGGAEISPSTYRRSVIAHFGLGAAAVVLVGALLWPVRGRADG